MTGEILSGLWRMSCQAGVAVCVVLAVRMVFSWTKMPKKYVYMLWMIPFLRMLIPWWAESPLSVFGSMQRVGKWLSDGFWTAGPVLCKPVKGMMELSSAPSFPLLFLEANPAAKDFLQQGPGVVHTNLPTASILLLLWGAGVLGLLVYCTQSYLKIWKRVRCGACIYKNIYLADHIESPFVFGIVNPRIYLPSDMEKGDMDIVILHEQVHIRRGDYLVKMTAFLAAVCHWFNPLCWIGFYCMCRDMEMSCDEAVIGRMGESGRREYAIALLRMTAAGMGQWGIPPAFSLGNPKGRIRHIMGYRKAAGFTVAIGAALLVLLSVILLTDPQTASAGREQGGAVLPTEEHSDLMNHIVKEDGTAPKMIFSYNGKDYDLLQRAADVNAIEGCTEVGHYIIVKGHIGPHNGYYGIFNTITEEFEKDIFGALLTYEAGTEAEVDLSDFVYCFWNDVYDGDGNLIASCQMSETESIYGLRVEDGEIYVDVLDIEAGEVVRTEKFAHMSKQG